MRSQIREGRTRSLQQCLFREFFICGHMLRGTVNRDFYEVWLDFAGSLISIFASFHFYSHGRTRADRDKLMRNAISRVRERGCSTETKSLRCTHIYIFLFTFEFVWMFDTAKGIARGPHELVCSTFEFRIIQLGNRAALFDWNGLHIRLSIIIVIL